MSISLRSLPSPPSVSCSWFPPTAATLNCSLLFGICSLPDTIFRNAVDMALADSSCCMLENSELRLSCFFNEVSGAKMVPVRVSTEVDARLAYDTHGIIRKGIEASRVLESEGIQMHLTFVYSSARVAAAACVIQIFVHRLRDWVQNCSGGPEIGAALKSGEDPALSLAS